VLHGWIQYLWPDHEPDDGCVATTARQLPTSSGGWIANNPWSRDALECGDGYYPVGLSRTPNGGNRLPGLPHALLCCPLPEPLVELDPRVRHAHSPGRQ